MSCPACEAALTSKWHPLIYSACRGCTVRSVSRALPAARARYLERMDPRDRAHFKAEMGAEIARQGAMT